MKTLIEKFGSKVGQLIVSRQLRIFAILALFSLPKHASFQTYGPLAKLLLSVLYYICYAVVALAVFEKVVESKDDDVAPEILSERKDAESYIQLTNITHKESSRDLKAHLKVTWGVDDTVAVEIEKLVEHVMTDFIHIWFDLISDDGDFVWVIKEVLGNAFGLIVQRGQSKVDPIAFVFDKIANILTKSLRIYRSAKVEVMKNNPELFDAKPIVSAEWKELQLALADEFRKKGRLHGMFGLRVSPKVAASAAGGSAGGEGTGGVPGTASSSTTTGPVRLPINTGQEMLPDLAPEEFFDDVRIHACETRYLRHISTLLFPLLMCNEGERNCKVIRSLLREVVANSVLYPIFALFVPSTMNYWLAIPRGCDIVAELTKSCQAEDPNAANNNITYLETTSVGVYSVQSAQSYAVATAPEGFSDDKCWQYLGGLVGIDETEELLKDKPVGTFLIRAMEMTGYYSLSFVNSDAVTASDLNSTPAETMDVQNKDGDSDDDNDDDSGQAKGNNLQKSSKPIINTVSHVLIQATPPSTFELVVMDMDTDKYPDGVVAQSLTEFMQKISSFAKNGIVFSKDEHDNRIPRVESMLGGSVQPNGGSNNNASGGHVDLSDSPVFTPMDGESSDEEDRDQDDEKAKTVTLSYAGAVSKDLELDQTVLASDLQTKAQTQTESLMETETISKEAQDIPLPISSPSSVDNDRHEVSAVDVDDEFRCSAERVYLLGELRGAIDEYITTYQFFLNRADESGIHEPGDCVEISDDRGCHSVGRLLTILETILCYGAATNKAASASSAVEVLPAESATLYDYFRDISAMILSWNEESSNLEEMLVGVQMNLDAVSLALSAEDVRNNPLMFATIPSIVPEVPEHRETSGSGNDMLIRTTSNNNSRSNNSSSSSSGTEDLATIDRASDDQKVTTKADENLTVIAYHRNRLRALIYHILTTGGLITCLEDMLSDAQSFHQHHAASLAERYWLPHSFAFSSGGESLKEVISICSPLVGKTVILREKCKIDTFGAPSAVDANRDRGDSNTNSDVSTTSPRRFPRPLSQKMAAGAMNIINMPKKMLNTTVSTVRNVANNVSSRFDSDPVVHVPINENDSFLVFGRNADIVDVSRMRRELANKEWGRRRGSVEYTADGKESSGLNLDDVSDTEPESLGDRLLSSNPFSSKKEVVVLTAYQKKAEKVFKLSMLLRDRPVIEVLSSRNIWHPSPMRFTAHITVVEKRESKSALHPLGTTVLLYKIAVEMTRSCQFNGVGDCEKHASAASPSTATDDGVGGGTSNMDRRDAAVSMDGVVGTAGGPLSAAVAKRDAQLKESKREHLNMVETWIVERRYSDFEELHKALKLSAGSVMSSRHISLPPKHNITSLGGSSFMDKRKQRLQGYMDNILATFGDSEEMRIFLSPMGTGELDMTLASVSRRFVTVPPLHSDVDLSICIPGPLLRREIGSSSNTVTGAIGGAASNIYSGVRNSIYGDMDSIKADLAEAQAMTAAAAKTNAGSNAGVDRICLGSNNSSPKPDNDTTLLTDDASITGLTPGNTPGGCAVAGTGGFSEYTSPAKMKMTAEHKNTDNVLQKKLTQSAEAIEGKKSTAVTDCVSEVSLDSESTGDVATSKPKIKPAMDATKIDMAILDKRVYPLLKELLDAGKMGAIRRNILVVILSSAKMLFSTEISKWMSAQSKDAVSHRTTAITLQYLRGCVWPHGKLISAGKVQSPEQDALMRERNKSFLVEKLHNAYVGNAQVETAIDKVQELLDNPYILKSIAYMIIDMLLIELFPELTGKLAGMDAIAI